MEIASQLISGKRFSEIDPIAVGISAASGAVTAAAGPIVGMVASGVGAGGADYVKEKSLKSAVTAGAVGAIASKVGGTKANAVVNGKLKKPSIKNIKPTLNKKKADTKAFFTKKGFNSWTKRHFRKSKTGRYFKSRAKSILSSWYSSNYQIVYSGSKRRWANR